MVCNYLFMFQRGSDVRHYIQEKNTDASIRHVLISMNYNIARGFL